MAEAASLQLITTTEQRKIAERLVGAELASANCEEGRRPTPGKPETPPDTWLLLSTAI